MSSQFAVLKVTLDGVKPTMMRRPVAPLIFRQRIGKYFDPMMPDLKRFLHALDRSQKRRQTANARKTCSRIQFAVFTECLRMGFRMASRNAAFAFSIRC
jgi:hypothetical protein